MAKKKKVDEKQPELKYQKKIKKKVNITVDPEVWSAFQKTCESQHTHASTVVGLLVKEYIEKNRQMTLS